MPLLSAENCKTLRTKTPTACTAVTAMERYYSQSSCRCDSRTQSESDVGSGDEGLGLFGFDVSSAETDFWWLEDEQ